MVFVEVQIEFIAFWKVFMSVFSFKYLHDIVSGIILVSLSGSHILA